mgnify:CR=1 FL=1
MTTQLEKSREQQLCLFNKFYIIDRYCNYSNIDRYDNDGDLANYIFENYDKMDEMEMKKIVTKCLTPLDMKRILLEYEFKNRPIRSPNIEMSLTDFSKYAQKLLNRYQSKAGGFYIEDTVWTMYTSTSSEYDVQDYEILFENSVDKLDSNDNEIKEYLDRLEIILDNICKNIDVEIRYLASKGDSITFILIWCVDRNLKKNKPKISL